MNLSQDQDQVVSADRHFKGVLTQMILHGLKGGHKLLETFANEICQAPRCFLVSMIGMAMEIIAGQKDELAKLLSPLYMVDKRWLLTMFKNSTTGT